MRKKNLKKMLSVMLLVSLVILSVAGCSGTKNEDSSKDAGGITYKAGTYTGSADGKNGAVQVEVTFSEHAIDAVKVVNFKETEGVSDASVTKIPKAIVDNQSLKIDAVSGATVTSDAILAAVADCVTQAGVDPLVLNNDVKKVESTEVEDLTTDVVVIGGGAAGMSASLRADELGLKTILLEKMTYIGGAISISGGNQVVGLSKLQQDAGVTDDSADSIVTDFLANGGNKNVAELLKLFAANVGQTTDWLNQYVGIKYDMAGGLHKLAEYSHDRELAYDQGGPGFAKQARQKVEESGVELYLETRADKLVTDDSGAVTGVVAKDGTGKTYNITAKAVIMATGGYGNNKDLLSDQLKTALYYGPTSSTGDGIVMAKGEGIDAATRLMEYGKRYPNGVEVSEGIAKSTIVGNIAAFKKSGILVNSAGDRVVNEKSSNRSILEVELTQQNQMLYLLMDQATFDVFKTSLGEAGISQGDIETWLKNNGSTKPYFFHAETAEALATAAGMDAGALQNTINRYNGFVKARKDEDFGRSADYMKESIGSGPYYLVEQKPRFATTMGGLVVNADFEVLNTSSQIISGLYAAGEVVGGVMGDDSPSGANNAWALTSGKLSAEAVVDKLK
ncbi:NADH:flavin oxidoreductase/NADH oxidase family protein [Paenibacillus sp. FSL R7-277]|uniref:FAD-dependent oxidoreductase n=1 Tax=Paenibacillus sp. FSL R7-277 TaxID=1227352 RepID=UPI0003E20E9A|nr:FAD-dependent oxidoreductase [Paenibacillus sp. FSL R7-277]ETT63234.1 NADH:flavin oxidoreductase/NADH oxidase family protein [Paenibacillus sp. FSL R7-277]